MCLHCSEIVAAKFRNVAGLSIVLMCYRPCRCGFAEFNINTGVSEKNEDVFNNIFHKKKRWDLLAMINTLVTIIHKTWAVLQGAKYILSTSI